MVESNFNPAYELELSASNLNGSPLSVYCMVKYANDEVIGRTETISNNQNPRWENFVRFQHDFDVSLKISFLVIDENTQQEIGKAISTLWLIAKFPILTCRLGDNESKIHIKLRETNQEPKKFAFGISGQDLEEMDFGGGSDPYIIIKFRDVPDHEVYRTEIIKKNINPSWRLFMLTNKQLRFNNPSEFLTIECWDYDFGRRDDFIGSADVTIEQILSPRYYFDISSENNPKAGIIKIECMPMLSTLSYLRNGLQFNFTFAIDFSSRTENLHDINTPFSYISALGKLSSAFEPFENDNIFFLYGFGVKHENQDITKHCFALNGNDNSAHTLGSRGLIVDYVNSKISRKSSKEACLHEVIEKTMRNSNCGNGELKYNILIILTNGEIQNINLTKNAIVDATMLPMSIVIFGMGNSRFSDMKNLTEWQNLKSSDDSTKYALRNIVQFFSYNNESSNLEYSTNAMMNRIFQEFEEYKALEWHKSNKVI
ncbi:hypothetical protein SteCoe_7849 [Stentor coeruleus]|uniref:C2 domain-containing protein n=1 Tax=Stentor coeruleus TaxID=5963 RepID=A0A1R2CLL8_9CILI|nr:hypothetical protein SteCoe_7849 [Stentor coeruleus]